MMANHWLDAATATWEECHDFLKQHSCAILPLGATEQHGPHLPQNTDTVIAEALASRVAEQSVGLVLPTLSIGYSWVWRDYAGSLTFSFDTFRAVIKDIARSLDRNGCCAMMTITAHGAIDYEMSALPMGALSKSGVFGDPTVATAEKGERWFNACVESIVNVWQEFLNRHLGMI